MDSSGRPVFEQPSFLKIRLAAKAKARRTSVSSPSPSTAQISTFPPSSSSLPSTPTPSSFPAQPSSSAPLSQLPTQPALALMFPATTAGALGGVTTSGSAGDDSLSAFAQAMSEGYDAGDLLDEGSPLMKRPRKRAAVSLGKPSGDRATKSARQDPGASEQAAVEKTPASDVGGPASKGPEEPAVMDLEDDALEAVTAGIPTVVLDSPPRERPAEGGPSHSGCDARFNLLEKRMDDRDAGFLALSRGLEAATSQPFIAGGNFVLRRLLARGYLPAEVLGLPEFSIFL